MPKRGLIVLLLVMLAACGRTAPSSTGSGQATAAAKSPIGHIIVIYLENRSFDHLYGMFPGADGLAQAGAAGRQVDKDGKPYDLLPPVSSQRDPQKPPFQLPGTMPNKPFDMLPFAPLDAPLNATVAETTNNFYREQLAIDGGKMDKFVAYGGSVTLGYYDDHTLPMWQYARQYVLADHFFHAAFGGTGLNHFWLFCACAPTWPNAPAGVVAQVAADGTLIKDGVVSPDGYIINNLPPAALDEVPPQTMPHIGDRLDAAGISWTWYAGGWTSQKAHPTSLFFFPFLFFQNLAAATPGASKHVKDESDFSSDLKGNDLPQVVFVKPNENEHPIGSSGLLQGEQHTAELVKAIQESPYWKNSAIIVTYDEGNGFWDHVAPPKLDRWGPGSRVPAIIISPYAKKGFVDKTVYDTTSILRFIEWRWSLQPLGERDAKANNLSNAFDFGQKP